MEDDRKFNYDAFISYAATKQDQTIAEYLHKTFQTYLIPQSLVKKGAPRRLQSILLEHYESRATLEDSTKEALRQSRFLVTVCSPRTPHSERVCNEIRFFKELGRSDRILPLLIEGDNPLDSFPALLYEQRRTELKDPEGNIREEITTTEPLAADIRASKIRQSLRLLKTERLRLIAPIIGCSFYELKPHDQKQRRKRLLFVMTGIFSAVLLVGLISLYFWTNAILQTKAAKEVKEAAAKQTVLAKASIRKIFFDIPARLKDNPAATEILSQTLAENLELLFSSGETSEEFDEFLVIKPSDSLAGIVTKVRILRRLGRVKEAISALDFLDQQYQKHSHEYPEHYKQYNQILRQFTIQFKDLRVKGGFYIQQVLDNGVAKSANLKIGDIIVKVMILILVTIIICLWHCKKRRLVSR